MLEAAVRLHAGVQRVLAGVAERRMAEVVRQRDRLGQVFVQVEIAGDRAPELGELGERFLRKRQPSLEAQIANVADEIAYNNHDVDDGLRSGLIELEQLCEVAIFKRHRAAVLELYPGLTGRKLVHETVRHMIDTLVTDLIESSAENIRRHGPETLEEIRSLPLLIGFSEAIREEQLELKRFLNENLYRHYRVARMSSKARRIVSDLFGAFLAEPVLLPPEFQARAGEDKARAIADYVAGMTDRYAILEHRRLFAVEAL